LSAARVKLADAFPREAGGPCDRREGDPLVAGDRDLGAEPLRGHGGASIRGPREKRSERRALAHDDVDG
jgi:hypothetical protein